MSRRVAADASFEKYEERGAYHWREVSRHLIAHNAFTAERYRSVVDRARLKAGFRVLDYGCGDGALLGMLARSHASAQLDLHGYDPNALALRYARAAFQSRRIIATLHESLATVGTASMDRVLCTEVIEHANAPDQLLGDCARVLKSGGTLVMTTPIRLTEEPEDPNHVKEWFPSEFGKLFDPGSWRVLSHEQVVPVAAVEAYFWRPPLFGRVPIFRLVANLLSIYAGVNAMTWLRLRPRLFMMQIVVAEKK